MEWLGQNWIWIAAAIVLFAFMSRRGLGHHGHGGFGGGHGGHGGGAEGGHSHGGGTGRDDGTPRTALDPVSGNAVRTDHALTSVHGGHIFYFESAETRQRFEAEPDKYAASATAKDASPAPSGRRSHRHGC